MQAELRSCSYSRRLAVSADYFIFMSCRRCKNLRWGAQEGGRMPVSIAVLQRCRASAARMHGRPQLEPAESPTHLATAGVRASVIGVRTGNIALLQRKARARVELPPDRALSIQERCVVSGSAVSSYDLADRRPTLDSMPRTSTFWSTAT